MLASFYYYCIFSSNFFIHIREKIFSVVLVALSIYFLLQARRSEVIGILFFLSIFLGLKLSMRNLLMFSMVVFLLMIIEFVRDVGLTSFNFGVVSNDYSDAARIPGASNIFVTLPTMIQIVSDDLLAPLERVTFDNWFMSMLPTIIYDLLGVSLPPLEGKLIIESKYGYIGGMYILTIGYLNGGIIGAMFFASLCILFASRLDFHLVRENSSILIKLISFAFAMSVMRLLYYHPIGIFKMIIYLTILVLFLLYVANKRIGSTLQT